MNTKFVTPFTPEDVKYVKNNEAPKNDVSFGIKKNYIEDAMKHTNSKDIHKIASLCNAKTEYGVFARALSHKELIISDLLLMNREYKPLWPNEISANLWKYVYQDLISENRTVKVIAEINYPEEELFKMAVDWGYDPELAYGDRSDNNDVLSDIYDNGLDELVNNYCLDKRVTDNSNIEFFGSKQENIQYNGNLKLHETDYRFDIKTKAKFKTYDLINIYSNNVPNFDEIYKGAFSDASLEAIFIK